MKMIEMKEVKEGDIVAASCLTELVGHCQVPMLTAPLESSSK